MIRVPKKIVDNDREPFPPGIFDGELTKVEGRQVSEPGKGDWCYYLTPSFSNLKPANEETKDPGSRPFTGYGAEMAVAHNGTSLIDLEEKGVEDWSSLSYPLTRGAGLLSQFALAVGAVKRDAESGDAVFELADFVNALIEGEYNEAKVRIRVSNRTPETRKDREGNIISIPEAERRTFDQLEAVAPIPTE